MRLPKLALAILLSLGVSIQGFASVVIEAPCPMTQAALHDDEAAMPSAMEHDCCTDADTFAGIRPADAPMFIVSQLIGALVAMGVAHVLFTTQVEK